MDVALTVGGSFLSSLLAVLFDRMARPEFLNLFREQKYDDRILTKLKWKLLILQAVLEDAESKQSKNLAVKKWLDELQEVVYQAEDLLDLINTEALRVKVESEYRCPTNQGGLPPSGAGFTGCRCRDMFREGERGTLNSLNYCRNHAKHLGILI